MNAKKPLILVTNDDGITAPGIRALIEVATTFGDVVVVAPDAPQSAMGHAITINDNGAGLPDGFNLEQAANLGLQIANTLTKNELNGGIKLFRSGQMTKAEVSFSVN